MSSMKVAVMAGGNGSHTIAADLSIKGLTVNLFEMEQFVASMRSVFETRKIEMSGVAGEGIARLNMVTSDIRLAVQDAEMVFIPLPGFTVSVYAKLLASFLQKEQMVVPMPGSLSALEFRETLKAVGPTYEPTIDETGTLAEKIV